MELALNEARVQQTIRKNTATSYGLTLVVGLPFPSEIGNRVRRIQEHLETLAPGRLTWYGLDQLHATLVAPPVADPVGNAGHEIFPEVAGQAKSATGLGEAYEHVLNDVLRRIDIADQRNRQLEQIILVLLVDPLQRVSSAAFESPDQQPVFHHRTHRTTERSFFSYSTPRPLVLVS